MEFKRTQRQHFLTILLFIMVSWLWYDFITAGTTTEIILGVICLIWAVLIAYSYLRTPILGRLDPDGLTLHRPFRSVSFTWDELQWADMAPEKRNLLFAYRHTGDTQDRFAGCGRKILTPEAVDAIVAAVQAARPDLPSSPSEAENGAKT